MGANVTVACSLHVTLDNYSFNLPEAFLARAEDLRVKFGY